MADVSLTIDGVRVPRFLYGTAWKEDETQRLTELALRQGFRGIDTANQRRHYHEAAVGRAVAAAIAGGLVTREELFLQTKFTFRGGPGPPPALRPRGPDRDPGGAVVRQFARAPRHRRHRLLRAARPDARGRGLGPADWEAWRAMEAIHDERPGPAARRQQRQRSNSSSALCERARVRPRFVQNRCYAEPRLGPRGAGSSAPRTGSPTRASRC